MVYKRSQVLAGPKKRHPFGWNMDRIAGLGITAHARTAVPHPEAPETAQLDLVPPTQGFDDTGEEHVDNMFRLLLGQMQLSRDPRG